LYRPEDVVAFAKKDVASPGFAEALSAAHTQGFAAIKRLAGGRAAVFHESTLAFAWTIPDPESRSRIDERFRELANLMRDAFRALGVDARIGEIPGEYCPGEYSINTRGERKIMGVGQRVVSGAAHVGGVIVVADGERIQRILTPIYAALGIVWRPETVGSIREDVGAVTLTEVAQAILASFAARYDLTEKKPSAQTLALAEMLEAEHEARREPPLSSPPAPNGDVD
jgi:lipoate-protein ligase A